MFYTKKIALILLITVFSLGVLYPISTRAQTAMPLLNTPSVFNPSGVGITPYSYSGIKPFGGKIIKMQPCKKPSGMMLTIGGPRGGQFLLTDSSQTFNYSVFRNGTWTLGNADASTVTCKGKKGLFSSGAISMGAQGLSMAISGIQLLQGGLGNLPGPGSPGSGLLGGKLLIPFHGDMIPIPVTHIQIGLMAIFIASKFIFKKKLDTLGHPHVIQIVGTSF